MAERAPRSYKKDLTLPASTILQTTTIPAGEADEVGLLSGATYTPNAAITGAASPSSRSLTIINKGQDGLGATVMATLAFVSAVNGVAFDEKDFTLSVVALATVVAAGDVLAVSSAPVGGTGLVDPGGLVQMTFARS